MLIMKCCCLRGLATHTRHLCDFIIIFPLSQVRDQLISKKQRLIRSLKEALSRVPRRIVAAVAVKFGEVEKKLRMKPSNIEEVADQRQFIDALPRKVAELVAEMDAAQV